MFNLILQACRRLHYPLQVLQQAQCLPAAAAAAATTASAAAPQAPHRDWLVQLLDRLRSHHTASCSHEESCCSRRAPVSFEEQEATCWSCHDRFHRGGLVCQACDKIQPSDPSLTYFDLLGYAQPTFDLDPAALEKRYKLLQWQLHPDKTVTRSAEEQQFSAEQATRVNQAYGVLRRPLSRANYMLLLAGIDATEHLEGTIADPDLLMEVMEAREEVEAEEDQQQLVRLHTANKQREADVCQQLSQAFAAGDLERARQLTAQLSYWVRLEEALAAKL